MNTRKDSNAGGAGGASGDAADWAALYVLGAVSNEERALCERRLATDAEFRAAVEKLRPLAESLSLAATPVLPPAGLLERVRERAGLSAARGASADADLVEDATEVQPWKRWSAERGGHEFDYLAADVREFTPTAVDGISVRKLFVDPVADRVTMLVQMRAGSSYPSHRHGGPEECYVLAGDIRVGPDLHMRAGDYQRADVGSVHPVQSTDNGCLLLITSSLHDELLALGE